MPSEINADWIADIKLARIMICSECGCKMGEVPEGVMFDVIDCSWTCGCCNAMFLSSDGWFRVGKLLLCDRE